MPDRLTRFAFAMIGLALALDQLSKWYLLEVVHIGERPPIEVTSFFNLVMVWNRGVSFGMLSEANQPFLLAGLALVIIAVLLYWLKDARSKWAAGAIGVTIGGALGNAVDRLRFGAVADFFDFHAVGYHWPAFNVADSAIFIGVVLLCLQGMFIPPYKPSSGTPS